LGVRNPHSKLQTGFQAKIVAKFAQLYVSTIGNKNVEQKNVVSGGISFVGVLTGNRALA